jgi:peptidoglycan L-alanyl-D-glutamate endopeptidase CwlK
MDSVSEQRLTLVVPELAQKIEATAASLMVKGIYIRVVQGLRSWADQAALYAQGRTAPGNIVTNAPPGHSMHEFGLAVDCMPSLNAVEQPYLPDGVGGSPRYVAMVAAGEAQGLVSGSTWVHMTDWPHFQLTGVPVSPNDEMRADFSSGGLPLVWSKALSGGYS